MKKKLSICVFLVLIITGTLFGQTSQFEGTWVGRSPITFFFDTLEYSFNGNNWVLRKIKNGSVTEMSEGTFTFTNDRIIMLQTRYKTTGDWINSQIQTGGSYRIAGNSLFLDEIEFTRTGNNPPSSSSQQNTNTGGLYYSITLPQNWSITTNHRYYSQMREALGINTAQGDYTDKAYTDSGNDNNFFFISEVPVPRGSTTAQLIGGTPATRVTYNGREFYVMSETFNRSSTMKVAYIVYRDVFHGFFFILENENLNIADQVFATIQFENSEKNTADQNLMSANFDEAETPKKKDGFFTGVWHGIRTPFVFIINLFKKNDFVVFSNNRTGVYLFGYILGILFIFGGGIGGTKRRN